MASAWGAPPGPGGKSPTKGGVPTGPAVDGQPKVLSASIDAYQTIKEDKRFTIFNISINTKNGKFTVFRRYSEFRDLYDGLTKAFPKDKFKFPKKRLMGNNFDEEFLQGRKKGLDEFIQKVLSVEAAVDTELVVNFFFDTPRHGRGPKIMPIDEPYKPDTSETDGAKAIPFDLGAGEDKKASVEDFMMMKVIGKGSFGRVLLGKHINSGTIYAIKVLSKEAIVKQNEVKHIMSERNVLLGNCRHPFLVGLHYSFQTPAKLYFILDYVNGGELFFHLQQEKKFSIARSQFYAAEITSALSYMHSLNIVYRDLKPENILLDSTGHVVLTDFGLCKENVMPGQTTATFCGTPEYLAPEVLKKHAYGRAVDWWCLGCVTYEMMCGLPPYYSRDVNEMYDRILHDTLRFPDHVPQAARQLLEGLLIRIPDQRLGGGPRDAEEVKAHLFFESIDWAALERREMEPPFNPNITSALDLSNIDPQFTQEPVPNSVMPSAAINQTTAAMGNLAVGKYDQFQGFSYTTKGALDPKSK